MTQRPPPERATSVARDPIHLNDVEFDVLIVGAGVVGMSLAYGLSRQAHRVCVLDEGDVALSASRGNFGLAWVQGKGANFPDYALWTIDAAASWPGLAAELYRDSGLNIELAQPGGFHLCVGAEEYERRVDLLSRARDKLGGRFSFEALTAAEVRERLPGVGQHITGATYCPMDGHLSPLKLLRALFQAFVKLEGTLLTGVAARSIEPLPSGGFAVTHASGRLRTKKLVLAAGLGSVGLAEYVGLKAPLRPVRGQMLITERARPFLMHPTLHVRQTSDGTVQIGDSKEDVGLDVGTTWEVLTSIAQRAVRCFPAISSLNVVRSWGALRVMSPDGFPIYEESAQHPGAFLITCHSGITLAPQHAGPVARWIASGSVPSGMAAFSSARF